MGGGGFIVVVVLLLPTQYTKDKIMMVVHVKKEKKSNFPQNPFFYYPPKMADSRDILMIFVSAILSLKVDSFFCVFLNICFTFHNRLIFFTVRIILMIVIMLELRWKIYIPYYEKQ